MLSRLQFQFLGAGDAFGSGGRFQTCFLLRGAAGALLIDCGASSLIPMRRAGVDPAEIGWILVTHLHGDHFGGIPFIILDGQFRRGTRPLVVAGPPGTRARVTAAMEVFFPGSSSVTRRFATEFLELAERVPAAVGPVTVTPYPVAHASGAPNYALRVQYGDKIVVYSGDTAWTDVLVEASQGADLFVCEAYYFEKEIKYHLDYRTLRDQLDRFRCRRIVLAHLSQDMLGHLAEVDVECVQDGQVITL